jgi:hypothetical protein
MTKRFRLGVKKPKNGCRPFKNRTICPVLKWLKQNGSQNIRKPDEFVGFLNVKWQPKHSKTGLKMCLENGH